MSSGWGHTAWDPWKTFNVTPEEAEQIRLRRKLRWAQKEEYLRREAGANFRFRPDNLIPGVAQDPAKVRWLAMHYSRVDHLKPNYRALWWTTVFYIGPVVCLTFLYLKGRKRVDEQLKSGEVPYKDRVFKMASHYSTIKYNNSIDG